MNAICPGANITEIDQSTEHHDLGAVSMPRVYPAGKIPLTRGEPGSADEVARLALFLASDDARHISGTEVCIDGTESLLAGCVSKCLRTREERNRYVDRGRSHTDEARRAPVCADPAAR